MTDKISDALNQIMMAKNAGKNTCEVYSSKLLIKIMEIMKKNGYINFEMKKDKFEKIVIKIKSLNECKSIRPRFHVKKDKFERYIRRFLPARGFGIIIVSTSKGLITHTETMEKNIGGSLIAYCF
jgi:small subunit ribosomal protein S8